MESEQTLPGEPSSVAKARGFAADTLDSWCRADVCDVATLVVSELVTNAVLHAGSDIRVRLVLDQVSLRVEVHDGSAVLPSNPDYGEDAVTGRGLHLVSLLADSWGAEPRPPAGKIVWCRLPLEGHGGPREAAPTGPVAADDVAAAAHPVAGLVVHLPELPVQLYRAVQQHNDALLREAALMAIGDPLASAASSAALSTQAAVVAALSLPVEDALAAAETSVDVTATLAIASPEAVGDLREALRDAEDLARRGILLSPPALPELRACREWLLAEAEVQQEGRHPEPWSTAPVLDRIDEDLLADVEHRAILDCLSDAVLIGDEENRVVYANSAVEQLLGWPANDLVGRRLTTIVPERLREAHVAGYSRYLVTGEPHILGFPVRVPARRRDGSETPVELTLNALRSTGRQMFVGALRAVTDGGSPNRRAGVGGAADALQAALAPLREQAVTLEESGGAIIRGVGEALGWQFAALWALVDGRLGATHIWQEGDFADFADVTLRQRFRPGKGLPGRAWAARELVWVTGVLADVNFPRADTALMSRLRTAFAVPLLDAGDQPLAVAEFYTTDTLEPEPDVLSVLSTIGVAAGALLGGR
ncbi:MAG TPA: PAS domain S-box protein [Egibacteraceae bacterium]|nr:PAS domain S-box protein [Egibacteraceae bacterium]